MDDLIMQIRLSRDRHFFDRQNLQTTEFPPVPEPNEEDDFSDGQMKPRLNSNAEICAYVETVAGDVLRRLRKLDKEVERCTTDYVPLVIDISKRVITRFAAAPWEVALFAKYCGRYGNKIRYPIPDKRRFTGERMSISPQKKALSKLISRMKSACSLD
ncbi:hypothetical protein L596_019389 [Steinernema carpocapsae]|uniref:Uncharacterized protein n=1 Tax=Steinernema carpocapsae TaxID=34508 RepID=A0A4U5MQC7_STECR|nr:hypothetical protein L596_019389 [Steinernema carpocapsae]